VLGLEDPRAGFRRRARPSIFAPRPVKILLTSHSFPPHGNAGTETYSAELAAAFQRRGHEVHVFTSIKDISRPDLSSSERWAGRVRVHELVNNLYYRSFRETWDQPEIERIFDELLERIAPDVVHVQHLLYLSVGCVEAAHRRSIPVVYTLHDYWLQCPRFGQRVHADGGLCHTIDFKRCGTCLPSFKYAQGDLERLVGPVVAGVRTKLGLDLGPLMRGAAHKLSRAGSELAQEPDASSSARFEHEARERSAEIFARLEPCVARFFAPSRFLRERFIVDWNIAPERIEHLRYGLDLQRFRPRPRVAASDGRLRIGFLGSFVPLKGAHVLLEAYALLTPAERAHVELDLHGPARHQPEYQERLGRRARELGVVLGPPLDREGVAAFLARTDLLVVPSLWYENAPLVILEALASKTPLAVSNLGGMAELVEPGKSGWHFALGDARALSELLRELVSGQRKTSALYQEPVQLERMDDNVDVLERRYRELIEAREQP
jgi:glycosyltransferase involved in cell wall biosynthesis